jgi:actin-related protein
VCVCVLIVNAIFVSCAHADTEPSPLQRLAKLRTPLHIAIADVLDALETIEDKQYFANNILLVGGLSKVRQTSAECAVCG